MSRLAKRSDYFLHLKLLDTSKVWRWIEYRGWETGRTQTRISICSPMGGTEEFDLAVTRCYGQDIKRCKFDRQKMNSEIVKRDEPNTFLYPSWQVAYWRTHSDFSER